MLDPLSEARYRLQVTGSLQFRDKLLRARDLMMHTNPNGDLAVVGARALDELIEVLEKRIFGKLSRKSTVESPRSQSDVGGSVPAPPVPTAPTKKSRSVSSTRRPGLARASGEMRSKGERAIPSADGKAPPAKAALHLRQRKSVRAAAGVNGASLRGGSQTSMSTHARGTRSG